MRQIPKEATMVVASPAQRLRRAATAAGAVLVACLACGPGNDGQPVLDPSLVRKVPWLNGGVPAINANGDVVLPGTNNDPPVVQLGLADPGSQQADCSPLGGYTFSSGWFDDFEPKDDPNAVGVAPGWASYDDLTKYSFHSPGDGTWYPDLRGKLDVPWGLPAEHKPGPSCDGKPNNWVLHFRGGLFRKWGAGISHAFTDPIEIYRQNRFADCPTDKPADFCVPPLPKGSKVDPLSGLPAVASSGQDYVQSHDFIDASSYDGVAFWARRGPEGQDHVLVILTDKFTSSRLARENQTWCRRVRECHSACLNGMPCSADDPTAAKPIYRCFDPAKGPLPPIQSATSPGFTAPDSLFDLLYPRCGKSACSSPQTYVDVDFDGKACRPYTFPAADESGEYCWNEGDPPPPSRDDRCQDGWLTVVPLSSDWTFHAIPFSQFGQVGFGKRAPVMDLTTLDVIAFGSTMGWADVYFDNVTLYRRKK
jgi:hypothetical protein